VIVIDASAGVLGLLNDGDARRRLASDSVAAPHLADPELAHALRAQLIRGEVTEDQAHQALSVWVRLGIRRFAMVGLLGRVWELRENVTAYDACYVALAEALDVPLVTADARLGLAAGPRCPITVIRS